MKIVVIGGTSLIGSKVVEKLRQKGHEAIAAAPNTGVNTITGQGLKEAMGGAQVVMTSLIRPRLKTRRRWHSSRPPAATFSRRRGSRDHDEAPANDGEGAAEIFSGARRARPCC